jgi:Arc/MetJ family transcription regulator
MRSSPPKEPAPAEAVREAAEAAAASSGSRQILHLMVYVGVMGRTNIEIDDQLIEKAMRVHRLKTKREAVDLALRRLVGESLSLDEARAMEGSGWGGDLDEMRDAERVPEP